MTAEIIPVPARVDRSGTGCTPYGVYVWIGDACPFGDAWSETRGPMRDFAQIVAVVDDLSEFDEEATIRAICEKTGELWEKYEEFDLDKHGVYDTRIYRGVLLRRCPPVHAV